MTHCGIFGLALAISAAAQPAIRQNGVVNAASRVPSSLAGGEIARGARFTIFGVHFAAPDHDRVRVSIDGKTFDARIRSATPEQIDAEMPRAVPAGHATITVIADGAAAKPFAIEVADANPGLFSRNGLGWGPASMVEHRGDRVAISGTGFGDSKTVEVVIGGRAVRGAVLGDRVEFSIPKQARAGCFVPVYLLHGATASNAVTIPIIRDGRACAPGPLPIPESGSVGVAVVSRTRTRARGATADFISDEAAAVFASARERALLSPLLLVPPAGSCTAYTGTLEDDAEIPHSIDGALVSLLGGRGLDAGPELMLRRGSESREVIRVNGVPGYYHARLGEAGPFARRRAPPLFLDPGEIALSAAGGTMVGAFEIQSSAPPAFDWPERDSLKEIARGRPLTLHWTGARGLIVIVASNVDRISTASATVMCTAAAGANHFTIPAELLAKLPASTDAPGARFDQLWISSLAVTPARFEARGVDHGYFAAIYDVGVVVRYY